MPKRTVTCRTCEGPLRTPRFVAPFTEVICPACSTTYSLRFAGRSLGLHALFFILLFTGLKLIERFARDGGDPLSAEVSVAAAIVVALLTGFMLGALCSVDLGALIPVTPFTAARRRIRRAAVTLLLLAALGAAAL